MAQGGRRSGAGRPAGSRDKSPRIKRVDVLNARREDWDKWEKNSNALAKARKRLLEIIEDKETTPRDVIAAVKMMEERGLGRPTEEREATPQQTLVIVRQPEPSYVAGPIVEGEIVQRALPSGD